MISILILTHGGMADELLDSARMVAGPLENFSALSLPWSDGQPEVQAKLEERLASMANDSGILILTDFFGGTPSNAAMPMRAPGEVEVVSGVNLPMVVRLGCLSKKMTMDLDELAHYIRDKGRKSICCGTDLPAVGPKLATPQDPCAEDEIDPSAPAEPG